MTRLCAIVGFSIWIDVLGLLSWWLLAEYREMRLLQAHGQIIVGRIIDRNLGPSGSWWDIDFDFVVDGRMFTGHQSISNDTYDPSRSKEILITYLPSDPDVHWASSGVTPVEIRERIGPHLLVLGIILVIGVVAFLMMGRRARRQRYLLMHGTYVVGQVEKIGQWVGYARWLHYQFRAGGETIQNKIRVTPKSAAAITESAPVSILYDPRNPKVNMMLEHMHMVELLTPLATLSRIEQPFP